MAFRVLLLVLVAPFVAATGIAYLVLSEDGQGRQLPVAQGASGGVFHPVAGSFEPDSRKIGECDDDQACLQQAFGNLSFREGPAVALALFEERIATDRAVENGCHQIAHMIGSAALERYDGDVARTFSEGSPTCVSGYYHGILDRAFLAISSKVRLAEVARSLCTGGGLRRRGFLDYQCRHGLGHGLMIQTGYDLPLALSICEELGTGWDHVACASGVFMENVNTRFGFRSPWLDDEDPVYPCTRVHQRDERSCYLRASWRILVSDGGDFARAAEGCAALKGWSRICWRGLGRDAVESARDRPARIHALCRLAGAGHGDCLLGAARTIANAAGAKGIAPAAALCRGAPRLHRAACFSGVGIVLGMLHPTNASRSSACAAVTPEHRRACLAAAIAEVDPSGLKSWG